MMRTMIVVGLGLTFAACPSGVEFRDVTGFYWNVDTVPCSLELCFTRGGVDTCIPCEGGDFGGGIFDGEGPASCDPDQVVGYVASVQPPPMPAECTGGADVVSDGGVDVGSDGPAEGDGTVDVDVDVDVGPELIECLPGATCDDGDSCTAGDSCNLAGECTGVPTMCDDGVPCTLDQCDSVTGDCQYPTDNCECTADAACADGADCTDDRCESDLTCSHTIDETNVCTDGDACSEGEFCTVAGACQPGTAIDCDDGSVCTDDSCDASTGECVNAAANDGGVCDDGEACTGKDQCAAGICVGGPPPTWSFEVSYPTPSSTVDMINTGSSFMVLGNYYDELYALYRWRVTKLGFDGSISWVKEYPSHQDAVAIVSTGAGVAVVANEPAGAVVAWIDEQGAIVQEIAVPDAVAANAIPVADGVVIVGSNSALSEGFLAAADSGGVVWGGDQGPGALLDVVRLGQNYLALGLRDGQVWVRAHSANGALSQEYEHGANQAPLMLVAAPELFRAYILSQTFEVVELGGGDKTGAYYTWVTTLHSSGAIDVVAKPVTTSDLSAPFSDGLSVDGELILAIQARPTADDAATVRFGSPGLAEEPWPWQQTLPSSGAGGGANLVLHSAGFGVAAAIGVQFMSSYGDGALFALTDAIGNVACAPVGP